LMQGNISTDYIRVGRVRYKYKLLPLFNRGLQNLISWYEGVIRRALKKRGRVLLVCFLVFGLSLGLLAMVGTELLPASDEGSINISVDVPYGTSLATTDKLMSQVEDYILQLPEVRHVLMNTSSISALSLGGGASFTVGLCSRTERDRTTDEVAKDIDNFAKNITGIDVSAASSSSIMGMFGDSDIAIYVMGKDLDKLEEVGRDIAARASHLDLVESAELDITEGSPEIKVLINRGTASFYGVTAYQLASGLSGALNGVTATNVSIDGEDIAVKLSLSDYYADSIENMKQIVINGNYGTPVTVG
ncbi:MAG: efflux RND transporter permease subunit, partial [Firmicutes bacterium]|nr:efflux RND transporter permease subunit [Bacillota bacterium]